MRSFVGRARQDVRVEPDTAQPTPSPGKGGRAAQGARAFGRGTAKVAGVSGRAGRATYRRLMRATQAQGAGESGLAKVIQMHGVSAAGDALVLLSLANTVFFSVPVGQARGRVALYLLITMAPFSLMAPVIGPLLDRFRSGRRYALAVTLLGRAFLAWVMAGAVAGGKEGFALYPAAFGHLVLSKAYQVTRAAATPRVLPKALSLVTANSRVMLGGVVAVAIATPIGGLLLKAAGPEWSLRFAFLIFLAGVVLALRLPPIVDSAEGEVGARLSSDSGPAPRLGPPVRTTSPTDETTQIPLEPPRSPTRGRRGRRIDVSSWGIGPRVVLGLRAESALRAFTGFLTLFLAFALRTDPISDSIPTIGVIGLVAGGAAAGNTVGTAMGALLRRVAPETVLTLMLVVAAVAATIGTIWYGLVTVIVVGVGAGLSSALGKLALDALVQREVPDDVRSSAFARSETVLQLAWVGGGALGISLPIPGAYGLGIAAVGLTAMLLVTLRARVTARRTPARAAAGRAS
jgi:MFS family permease